jgi:hypothetical protein
MGSTSTATSTSTTDVNVKAQVDVHGRSRTEAFTDVSNDAASRDRSAVDAEGDLALGVARRDVAISRLAVRASSNVASSA